MSSVFIFLSSPTKIPDYTCPSLTETIPLHTINLTTICLFPLHFFHLVHLSIRLPFYLSIYLCIHKFTSIYSLICYLSFYPFVPGYPNICLSPYLFLHIDLYISFTFHYHSCITIYPYIYSILYLFGSVSIFPSIKA